MITQEAVELCEQSNNYINEIECLNGTSELAIYRAVKKERSKWEARWLSECSRRDDRPAEATRSRPDMNECAGIGVSRRKYLEGQRGGRQLLGVATWSNYTNNLHNIYHY